MRILLTLTVICSSALAGHMPTKEPKVTELKPTLLLCGSHSAIRKEKFLVVTETAKWLALWKEHRGKNPQFTEPGQDLKIDFESHYVVAIFTGDRSDLIVSTLLRGDEVVMRLTALGIQTAEGVEDNRTAHEKARDEASADYCFVILPKPIKTVAIERDYRRQLDHPPLWKETARFPLPNNKN